MGRIINRHVVRDLYGVTHVFEAASWHNTRCGLRAPTNVTGVIWTPIGGRDGAQLPNRIVDCIACLVGRSHLSVWDLRNGHEVQAWVRLDGKNGPVGSAQPITFTRGVNENEVTFDDLPVGITVYGYSYLNEDGCDLYHHVSAFPKGLTRRSEDDTVMISVGGAVIR